MDWQLHPQAARKLERWVELTVLVSLIAMIALFVLLPITHSFVPSSSRRALMHRLSLPGAQEHHSHPMPRVAVDRG